jgi:membrane protease YdiL (CAAX protease family)
MRPLHVLVFLLPLVLAYELGSFLYLSDIEGKQLSVSAQRLFADFFHAFGLAGAWLPGLALVAVFLTWHIMIKDRWQVDPNTLGGMLLESVAWTLPLLVLSATVVHAQRAMGVTGGGSGLAALAEPPTPDKLGAMAALTVSIGAGLYEEMLFRLVGLALLHFVLVDLIGLTARWAYPIAIFVCALAFALYHQGQGTALLMFRTLAGVYLGTVYVMRGFGIVVGTHAIFDVLALVILPGH